MLLRQPAAARSYLYGELQYFFYVIVRTTFLSDGWQDAYTCLWRDPTFAMQAQGVAGNIVATDRLHGGPWHQQINSEQAYQHELQRSSWSFLLSRFNSPFIEAILQHEL